MCFVRSLRDPFKLQSAPVHSLIHICAAGGGRGGRGGRTPQKNTKPGSLLLSGSLFVHEFMRVSLLGAYCSSKSCNDRFFFLFYAELGSVIRAPFLTDRSILITKSSACSKGSALWRPCAAGATARATPADRNGTKQAGRWGGRTWLGPRWRQKLALSEAQTLAHFSCASWTKPS